MPQSTILLQVSHCFAHSPSQVFDRWLDDHSAGHWMFATPNGKMVQVDIDARVGGRYTVVEHRNGVDVLHTGEYHEIERPHRLMFSFSTEPGVSEPDLVKIEISPGPLGCELTLSHQMSANWAKYRDKVIEGWTHVLIGLAAELNSPPTKSAKAAASNNSSLGVK